MFQFPVEDIWLDDDDPPARPLGGLGHLSARDREGAVFEPLAGDVFPPAPTLEEPGPSAAALGDKSAPDPDVPLGRDEEPLFARDENDVLVRRERESRERFRALVTVVIDGFPIQVPRALPKTDAQGNVLRDPAGNAVPRTASIYDAAAALVAAGTWTEQELQSRIPTLCHLAHTSPVGMCRMCSVHISSAKRGKLTPGRKLVPACQHRVETDMVVTTRIGFAGYNPEARGALDERTARAIQSSAATVSSSLRVLAELFVASCYRTPLTESKRYDDELFAVARSLGVITGEVGAEEAHVRPAFRRRRERPSRNAAEQAVPASRRIPLPLAPAETGNFETVLNRGTGWEEWNAQIDTTYPYSSRTVVVDHDRCIVCDRCVRACGEVKPFKVIGHTGKGYGTRISFDLDSVMRDSTCVQCGECMNSCPTGALSLRRRVGPRAWGDAAVHIPVNPNTPLPEGSEFLTADEMREVWLVYESPTRGPRVVFPFRSIPYSYLKWNEGAVRRWEIPPGERKVLCEEGDYGSTAFLLQGTGTFEIRVRGFESAKPGLLGGLFGRSPPQTRRASEGGHLVRVLPGNELILGEAACLNQRPWAATVVAVAGADQSEQAVDYDEAGRPVGAKSTGVSGPVVVYEVTRNVLDLMQRSAAFREDIQEIYSLRALQTGVQNGRLFGVLDREERAQAVSFLMHEGVTFVRVEAGETIVAEGDPAAAFYIIRLGTVRMFTKDSAGEQIFRLRSGADSFGEDGLLSDALGTRTATVAALDPVELVRIPGPTFRRLCDKFPKLKEAPQMVRGAAASIGGTPPDVLREYVRQGLFQGQKLLAIDLASCTRCDECTKACADSHDGNARLLLDGLRFGDFLVATSCRSCHRPFCMDECPVDAIHRRGNHLEVVIENHCIGCGLCERNCPYGAIHMVARPEPNPDASRHAASDPTRTAARRAVNCDLCNGNEPYCVYACPHDAAHRVTGPELLRRVTSG